MTNWDPMELEPWGDRLAGAFGLNRGVWVHDGAAWTKLAAVDPRRLQALPGHLAAALGPW